MQLQLDKLIQSTNNKRFLVKAGIKSYIDGHGLLSYPMNVQEVISDIGSDDVYTNY